MSGLPIKPPASEEQVAALSTRVTTAEAQASAADTKATQAKATADAVASDMLTGADRQQALRVQVTPNASGQVVFTYPKAYVTGTKPAIQVTAETPDGATYRNDAGIIEGSATNTQVTVVIQRVPRTLTVSVLGAVLNIFAPVTTPVWLNIFIRAPV